ncbi:hypothetical protein KKG65_03690 [Patescibacteria group bacterium]|nr:hypothetical protein [Patescibacteria group bacterium]
MKVELGKLELGLVILLLLFLGLNGYLGWRWYQLGGGVKRGRVVVSSRVEGYGLEIGNKRDLNKLLDEVGFWQKDAVIDLLNPGQMITPTELEVVLVERIEKPWWRQVTAEGKMVAEVGVRSGEGNRAVVEMAMMGEILNDDEKRDQRANSLFIYGLHGLVLDLAVKNDLRGEGGEWLYESSKKYQDYKVLTITTKHE